MPRLAPLALALVALLASGCSSSWNSIRAERRVTATPGPATSLVLTSRNGAVRAIAEPGRTEVFIEATLRCGGATMEEAEARLGEAALVAIVDDAGILRVEATFPQPTKPNDGASITVRLPELVDAELKSSNGAVLVEGATGQVQARSSNGGVDILGPADDVVANTSNGKVVISGATGRVEATSSNGSLRIATAPGASAAIVAATSNGSISLEVAAGFAGRIAVGTSNGSIRIEDPGDRVTERHLSRTGGHVVIGGVETPKSSLNTSNGSITIRTGS